MTRTAPIAGDAGPTPGTLQTAERRERRRLLLLLSPALLLIGLLLLVPFCWLAFLSFLDGEGHFSFTNYLAIAEQDSTLNTLATTFRISVVVTLLCALLGYPVAYVLGLLPPRVASICLLAVLLPFWTSILVRTYAWMVLLARRGIVNEGLQDVGLTSEPLRLMHNETGTIIGMTHIMLPFLILPLYATIRAVDRRLLSAGANLGARPLSVFWRIFFPLTLPGLFGGACFVFVLCLGFFVTPALLGGGRVQMIAMVIERSVSFNASWGPASALGVVLLLSTVAVLAIGWRLQRRRGEGS